MDSLQKYELSKLEKHLVFDDLFALFAFAPVSIVDQIDTWVNDSGIANGGSLKNEILREIKYLKSMQYDSVSFRGKSTFEFFTYFFYNNGFSNLIKPLLNTCITIMAILFAILFLYIVQYTTILNKVIIIVLFGTFI